MTTTSARRLCSIATITLLLASCSSNFTGDEPDAARPDASPDAAPDSAMIVVTPDAFAPETDANAPDSAAPDAALPMDATVEAAPDAGLDATQADSAALDAAADVALDVAHDVVPDTGLDAAADAAADVAADVAVEAGCTAPTSLDCAGQCTDPASLDHCGTCSHDCSHLAHVTGGVACAAGACSFAASSCATGWAHCSANADDGCETNITTPAQCGGCGSAHVCAAGDQCLNGSCVFVVSGHAVDLSSAIPPLPLAGRQVAFLDAQGHRSQVTTDATGAFSVSGIVPPYDALVFMAPGAGPPMSIGAGPNAYLGLTTAHPRLGGAPTPGATATRTATLNVPLALMACGATNCRYSVAISQQGSSQLSGGGLGGLYDAAHLSQTASGPVPWQGASSAVFDLHVLASDSGGTHYWYGSVLGVTLSDATTVTLPTITPAAVPILDSVALTADMSRVSGWGAPLIFAQLVFPGGALTTLQQATALSLSAPVPDIPGASLYLGVNSGYQGQGADAFALAQLTNTNVTIPVVPPATVTSPLPGAQLSVATGQIAWSGGSPADVRVVYFLYEPDGGGTLEGQAWTSASSIDVARLTTLGLTLTGGPTTVLVTGTGKVTSLNDMVDEQTLATPDETDTNGVTQSFTLTP